MVFGSLSWQQPSHIHRAPSPLVLAGATPKLNNAHTYDHRPSPSTLWELNSLSADPSALGTWTGRTACSARVGQTHRKHHVRFCRTSVWAGAGQRWGRGWGSWDRCYKAPGISCFSQSYADQNKISILDFFRSLNPSGELMMPVGEFRKAMIQVGGCPVSAGTGCACVHVCVTGRDTARALHRASPVAVRSQQIHLLYRDPEGRLSLPPSPPDVILCTAWLDATGDPRCCLKTHILHLQGLSPHCVWLLGRFYKGVG